MEASKKPKCPQVKNVFKEQSEKDEKLLVSGREVVEDAFLSKLDEHLYVQVLFCWKNLINILNAGAKKPPGKFPRKFAKSPPMVKRV